MKIAKNGTQIILLIILVVVILLRFIQLKSKNTNDTHTESISRVLFLRSFSTRCEYDLGRYSVVINHCERYHLGSLLRLYGRTDTGDDNGVFSKKRLIVQDIDDFCSLESSVKCGLQHFLVTLYDVKNTLLTNVMGHSTITVSGLISSLIFGDRARLPSNIDHFIKVIGMQHIAAVSGFHVGLVVGVVRGPTKYLPRWLGVGVLLVAAWLYAIMVGAKPSVVRAVMMISFSLLAGVMGRQYHRLWTLCLVAAVMLLVNPWYVLNVSFQLSISATLAIALLVPVFRDSTSSVVQLFVGDMPLVFSVESPVKAGLFGSALSRGYSVVLDVFVVSLAAQLGTLPLVLYHFGSTSAISLLASPVVLPFFPLVMYALIIWLLVVQAGSFGAVLSKLLEPVVLGVEAVFTWLLSLFGGWEWGIVQVDGFTLEMVIAWYVAVLLFWLFFSRRKRYAARK